MQNRPTLAQFARQLRTKQTDCEHLLWQKLRSRQIANLNFAVSIHAHPMFWTFTALN